MLKLIKTAEDYEMALNRIEKIMDSKPGTPEFDELELLSTLVDIYEENHFFIDKPDPVAAIKFRMEQLGMKQQDLIPFIGSRSKVSEILNKKRNLTLPMIRALVKGLGIPSDVLLTESTERDNSPQLEYEKFPVKEMIKKGWITRIPESQKESEKVINELIQNAGGIESAGCCLFRQSKGARENVKNDTYALTAWCLKLLEVAKRKNLPEKYIEGMVDEDFLREVAKLSYFSNGPELAKEYLEKHGVHFIVLPHLSKTYLDGAAILMPDKNPVIGLTLRYDRVDNFWFCLLHELAHLSRHLGIKENSIFVDDLDLRKYGEAKQNDLEQQADSLAQKALIPDSELWEKLNISRNNLPDAAQIIDLANKFKISPAIIAGRIRYETNNYRKFTNLLGIGGVRKFFSCN